MNGLQVPPPPGYEEIEEKKEKTSIAPPPGYEEISGVSAKTRMTMPADWKKEFLPALGETFMGHIKREKIPEMGTTKYWKQTYTSHTRHS